MAANKPYRVHPQAWLEIEGAIEWYQVRSHDASVAFIAAVADALENISRAPRRWPAYKHGTQRYILPRFPFSIVYFDGLDAIEVVALAHGKRKPGYWKRRF